jgi:hypothetical protein
LPYAVAPALVAGTSPAARPGEGLSEPLKKPYAILAAMSRALAGEPGADFERAFVATAIESFDAYRNRTSMNPGPGYFRPITPERKAGIEKFYERAALTMYNGLVKRMEAYAAKGDPRQKELAALFAKVRAEEHP